MTWGDVLIVEDESELADLYADLLNDAFETTVAYDGEQALEILDRRADEIDVVLLDRLMPGISGDDVLETIRERDLECSVAMVTAVNPGFDIVQMGFDDYLTKPVEKDELRETVERLATQSTYDEHVRDYLALVSKKIALEEEKQPEVLETSEEYARLERELAELRSQLEDVLSGDVFVQLLLRETGDRLYFVLEYDADAWEYRYVNGKIDELVATMDSNIDDMVDEFRREGRQKARSNEVFELGGYYCSLHLFDTVVHVHFFQADGQGIIFGFDPRAASNLTEFVSLIRPYLLQADADTVGGDPGEDQDIREA
jgi:DNA-binding response OmpR family regulator